MEWLFKFFEYATSNGFWVFFGCMILWAFPFTAIATVTTAFVDLRKEIIKSRNSYTVLFDKDRMKESN